MKKLLALIVLGSAFITPSHADVVYTSTSDFSTQLAAGAYTETFDTHAYHTSAQRDYSNGTYRYSISSALGVYVNGEFVGANVPNQTLTIVFTGAAVTAFGANFYNTNLYDFFQANKITISLSNGSAVSFEPLSVADSYRGFTTDIGISSVTISNTALDNFVSLDNLTVGARLVPTDVPEPASLALTGAGLLGLAALRRRRQV